MDLARILDRLHIAPNAGDGTEPRQIADALEKEYCVHCCSHRPSLNLGASSPKKGERGHADYDG